MSLFGTTGGFGTGGMFGGTATDNHNPMKVSTSVGARVKSAGNTHHVIC